MENSKHDLIFIQKISFTKLNCQIKSSISTYRILKLHIQENENLFDNKLLFKQ